MDLSIIIVNYNVKYFLEQVLLSIRNAAEGVVLETIVVDNNSVDGSVEMVREKFPEVQVIANVDNPGFSVANNQGITISKGRYYLLLNPDTLVEEDTFRKIIAFMDSHEDAGGLGVKMYDGKGSFLPESKRGLPTPWVAFCKMSGLGSLLSRSATFNHYYMGHLSADETNEVEVLSGAFMLLRASLIKKIGGLDETFFMYGEDIDLSYRINLAGFKNYYFAGTRIIHYKGESTKKGSLNYVMVFYQAMIIFAQKHFSGGKAQLYVRGIKAAIYVKAALTLLANWGKQLLLPLLDALSIYLGMWLIKDYWQNNVKLVEGITYAAEYMLINVPLYVLIWLVSVFFSGGYDKPFSLGKAARGIIVGTVLISAVYGFLPESLRFSRAMILLGSAWAIAMVVAWRAFLNLWKYGSMSYKESSKRAVIIGNHKEATRVRSLLLEAKVPLDLIGFVSANKEANDSVGKNTFVGRLDQLTEVVEIYKLDELIFCARDVSAQETLQSMIDIGSRIDYKIVPAESLNIIGSNSKHTAGDVYTVDVNLNLNKPASKRSKRVLDLGLCLTFLLLLPIAIAFVKNRLGFIANWFSVLLGSKSWVGYAKQSKEASLNSLPKLKKGVLSPIDSFSVASDSMDDPTLFRINLLYAKDYESITDLEIIWKAWKQLGIRN